MKILRFAAMLVVLLASLGGAAQNARADTITCWKFCDPFFYSGTCTGTLAQCRKLNNHCPVPYTLVAADCSDGVNSCP